jgi:putative aldouronate transport system substrate-binding protein
MEEQVMKKMMILWAGVLIGVLFFSACRQSGKKTESGEAGKVTLRILASVGQGEFPEGSDENHNIFVDFLREKTPYDYDFTFYNGSEDRNALIASGVQFDMIHHEWGSLQNLLVLQQQNYLNPLDDYLLAAPNITSQNQTPEAAWIPLTIEGKKYAIPASWSELYFGIGVHVDWLEKLGLQPPKDINELKNVLVAFRDRDPDGNGIKDTIPLSLRGGISPNLRSLWGIPADYMLENGKVQSAFATNAARDMVGYLADLYVQGLIDPEFATMSGELEGQRVTNNQIGCIFNVGWWDMKFWDIAIKESQGVTTSPFWWIPPPNDIYGKPVKLQISGPADLFWIFPKGGNTKEAVDFMDRILDPAIAETLQFGFEGIHWDRDSQGKRYLTEEYNSIIWRWKYCDGIIFNRDMMLESENMEYGDYRLPIQQYAGDTDTWELPTPPVVGIELQLVDINEHTGLEITKFIMGNRPLREYDAFIGELRNLGLDEVLAAKQKAWDESRE